MNENDELNKNIFSLINNELIGFCLFSISARLSHRREAFRWTLAERVHAAHHGEDQLPPALHLPNRKSGF